MSDIAMNGASVRGGDDDAATFRPLTVAVMVVIGIAAFAATLVLGAYVPDLKPARGGGTHAQSNGATGFSGVYQLAQATGRNPRMVRVVDQLTTTDLVVLSPPDGVTDVGEALGKRNGAPTLMILPKWLTRPDPKVTGWVRAVGLAPRFVPEGVLAPGNKLKVTRTRGGGTLGSSLEMYDTRTMTLAHFVAPNVLQTVSGAGLRPIVTDGAGRIVLGELGSNQLYVLADPDLLSNLGVDNPATARAALALLDFVGPAKPEGIVFDLTVNGLGRRPNPLKLAFEPPFLAMTLAVAAVLLLVGCQAYGRFGAARPSTRAIAFGKAALVDDTAALVRKARREAAMGGRYVAMIRERATASFGVPAHLSVEATDAYLDRIDRRGRFSTLAIAAERADDPQELLAAAQALHTWQQGNTE
jgi:hypothetical protein